MAIGNRLATARNRKYARHGCRSLPVRMSLTALHDVRDPGRDPKPQPGWQIMSHSFHNDQFGARDRFGAAGMVVARPPLTSHMTSSRPWITRVGTDRRPSCSVRCPEATDATACRAMPTRSAPTFIPAGTKRICHATSDATCCAHHTRHLCSSLFHSALRAMTRTGGALYPPQAIRASYVTYGLPANSLMSARATRATAGPMGGRRDRAMLTLTIQAGLRVAELVAIDCGDVTWRQPCSFRHRPGVGALAAGSTARG